MFVKRRGVGGGEGSGVKKKYIYIVVSSYSFYLSFNCKEVISAMQSLG